MTRSLLLYHVTYNPVGHIVEALKLAKGFSVANSDLKISVMLNQNSPTELTQGCDWINTTYAIDPQDVLHQGIDAPSLAQVPREWDYIAFDDRASIEYQADDEGELDLVRTLEVFRRNFKTREWAGNVWKVTEFPSSLKYSQKNRVVLRLPQDTGEFLTRYKFSKHNFCLLLGGSASPHKYPAISTWKKIIAELYTHFPDITIFITGITQSTNGRTRSPQFPRPELEDLFVSFPNIVNCYDIGLWNQLALIQACEIFISPHSGFGFLAPCVGTPWLTLSWRYQEYFFNEVPFYSALPPCEIYPCYESPHNRISPECAGRIKRGERDLCADEMSVLKRIPDLIHGAKLLVEKKITYEQALKAHLQKIGHRWNFDSPFVAKEDCQ